MSNQDVVVLQCPWSATGVHLEAPAAWPGSSVVKDCLSPVKASQYRDGWVLLSEKRTGVERPSATICPVVSPSPSHFAEHRCENRPGMLFPLPRCIACRSLQGSIKVTVWL